MDAFCDELFGNLIDGEGTSPSEEGVRRGHADVVAVQGHMTNARPSDAFAHELFGVLPGEDDGASACTAIIPATGATAASATCSGLMRPFQTARVPDFAAGVHGATNGRPSDGTCTGAVATAITTTTHAMGAAPPASTRKSHPSYAEWRAEKLSYQSLSESFCGRQHNCRNLQSNGSPCHVGLWGDNVQQLRQHLELVLPERRDGARDGQSLCGRDSAVRRSIQVKNHVLAVNANRQHGQFVYMVHGRPVCAPIFGAHWGLSRATLQRYVADVKKAEDCLLEEGRSQEHLPREALKRDYVVAWVSKHAQTVTEELPDCSYLLIPRIGWADFHSEFASEMRAAGAEEHLCSIDYFRVTFKTAEALKHIQMNRHKKNFAKCAECIRRNAAVDEAVKSHNAQKLAEAKAARLTHYGLARADKVNYYDNREEARQPHSLKVTLIVDKMDSAKNQVPWYSNLRKPKDAEDILKDVLKVHITGVIIHGRPDKRYLFWSLPHLPGNANLNLECIRRALCAHLQESTAFKPKLYLQFDNASDNKNYTAIVLCAWLVHHDYVSQVELVMMMVGHTHEDIDAMFRFIADRLRARGLVRTLDELVAAAREAFPNMMVEQVEWVYDYYAWLKESQGDFDHFKEHRYFVITKRETDGVVAMWTKPDASHTHLYPTKKDAVTGMPLFTEAEDGAKTYITCPEGIEILKSPPPHDSVPPPQRFHAERLDVHELTSRFEALADLHPTQFDEVRPWWRHWRDTTCIEVSDAVSRYPSPFNWPRKCSNFQAPTLEGLRQEYSEAVRYRNAVGTASFTLRHRQQARDEETREAPKLNLGDLIAFKAPSTTDKESATPFWLGQVAVPEVLPSCRVIEDITWFSCFKNGIAQSDISGSWKPVCVGYVEGRGGVKRYHPYSSQCKIQGRDKAGHGRYHSSVERDTIVLHDVKLTPRGQNLSTCTKLELWKLRQHLSVNGGIPSSFAGRGVGRVRDQPAE